MKNICLEQQKSNSAKKLLVLYLESRIHLIVAASTNTYMVHGKKRMSDEIQIYWT